MILHSEMTYPVRASRLHAVLADFDGLERLARQNTIEITRTAEGDAAGQGRVWQIRALYKGVSRALEARVAQVTPPEGFNITATTEGLHLALRLQVSASDDVAATAHFTATLTPRGLGGRLLVQPLRLAHRRVEEKFHTRLVAFTRARLKQARGVDQADAGSR